MSQPAAYDSLQVVVFALGSEEYALPIAKVHEIIRFTEPRSVSARQPWIRGVIALRGRIVRVYDLATRMGLSTRPSANSKIVIVDSGGDETGVVVDSVEEVLTIGGEHLEPSPAGDRDLIEGVAKIGDRLIVLLNVEGIFAGRGAAGSVPLAAVPAAA